MAKLFKKLNLPEKHLTILVFLLAGDLFYILLHLIHKGARHFDLFTTIRMGVFGVHNELSLGESYQYLKEYWIMLIFIWLIFRHKKYFYTGWAFLFLYFLLTDMLSIHNNLGTFILEKINIDPFYVIYGSLRPQDFGELAVSIFFGILIFSIIVFSYFRGGREVRTTFHYLFGGVFIIVFFGVINDTLNRIFDAESSKALFELTRLIEDGGEMIGMSLMCWYVFTLIEPKSVLTES